jgi:FkbM family methyltransferase
MMIKTAVPAPQYQNFTNADHLSLFVRKGGKWDKSIAMEVITSDYYFMEELKRKGGHVHTCIDVGGHIGSFGALAKALWPEARVTSYEASPENQPYTEANAELHGFDLVKAALVGEVPESGTVSFCTHLAVPGNANTGGGAVAYEPTALKEVAVEALPAESIFTKLKKGRKVIDLVKFDCEGSEKQILTALAEKGLMKHIGWLRGEYHGGDETITILKKALDDTHEFSFEHRAGGIGFFIAHNRKGPVPYSK